MSWKALQEMEEQEREIISEQDIRDAFAFFIETITEPTESEASQPDPEPEEEPVEEVVVELTRIEAFSKIVDNTLLDILHGDLIVENAQELESLWRTVYNLEAADE